METTIRAISPDQLPEIRGLCRDFFRESKYPGEFAQSLFEGFWTRMISEGQGLILTAQRLNVVLGMVGVVTNPSIFNGELTTTYSFWYVKPEARRSGIGGQLHDRVEYLSRHRGAKAILAGHILTINPTGLREYFESQGYTLRELVFRKEL